MSRERVVMQIDVAERRVKTQVLGLQALLAQQSPHHLWLQICRLWPCHLLTALLEQLRASNYKSFSPNI